MIGFLNVYKPQNMSSAAVVGKIKKTFKLNKVGHMGTLDPLACGILPIAIGKATRMFNYFLNKHKKYYVIAEFGYETLSLDLGTEKCDTTVVIPTKQQIDNIIYTLTGKLKQVPPAYSAKNINGEKAYKMARAGKTVNLEAAQIEVLQYYCVEQINKTTFSFEIECSSGTYVRSLIKDLAVSLNSLATVVFLERTESEFFTKDNSIKLEDLLNLTTLENSLISVESVFKKFNEVEVTSVEFEKLKNGLTVEINKADTLVFVKNNNVLLGLGEIKSNVLKLKTFLLEN